MDDAFGARPFDGSLLSLSLTTRSLSLSLFRSLLRDFFVRMPFSVIVARAMGKYGPIGMDRYVAVTYIQRRPTMMVVRGCEKCLPAVA